MCPNCSPASIWLKANSAFLIFLMRNVGCRREATSRGSTSFTTNAKSGNISPNRDYLKQVCRLERCWNVCSDLKFMLTLSEHSSARIEQFLQLSTLKDPMCMFWLSSLKWIQWGSENRTCPVFEWRPYFEWLVDHSKTGHFRPVFECFWIKMAAILSQKNCPSAMS